MNGAHHWDGGCTASKWVETLCILVESTSTVGGHEKSDWSPEVSRPGVSRLQIRRRIQGQQNVLCQVARMNKIQWGSVSGIGHCRPPLKMNVVSAATLQHRIVC